MRTGIKLFRSPRRRVSLLFLVSHQKILLAKETVQSLCLIHSLPRFGSPSLEYALFCPFSRDMKVVCFHRSTWLAM